MSTSLLYTHTHTHTFIAPSRKPFVVPFLSTCYLWSPTIQHDTFGTGIGCTTWYFTCYSSLFPILFWLLLFLRPSPFDLSSPLLLKRCEQKLIWISRSFPLPFYLYCSRFFAVSLFILFSFYLSLSLKWRMCNFFQWVKREREKKEMGRYVLSVICFPVSSFLYSPLPSLSFLSLVKNIKKQEQETKRKMKNEDKEEEREVGKKKQTRRRRKTNRYKGNKRKA